MTNDSQPLLFTNAEIDTPATPTAAAAPHERPAAAPRVHRPERTQAELRCESLDQRLDAEHTARLIWQLVQGLDLSSLYQQIAAVEGVAGRKASDPRVLFALWLYAATEGVGSARELARLCFDCTLRDLLLIPALLDLFNTLFIAMSVLPCSDR